jgi:probable phosphoglycerate mutase
MAVTAPPPRRLYFIRHGETDWNAEGRLQGQQDIPINPRGRAQADEVAGRLAGLVADPGALPWRVSPLGRTRETAEIARRALRLPESDYELDPDLREISFGRWEGLTWKELRKADPAAARAREADKWAFVPPGGESYAMLTERMRPFATGLDRDMVVVSHGGVARALLRLLCGLSAGQAPSIDIWQGRVLLFEGGSYRWV